MQSTLNLQNKTNIKVIVDIIVLDIIIQWLLIQIETNNKTRFSVCNKFT